MTSGKIAVQSLEKARAGGRRCSRGGHRPLHGRVALPCVGRGAGTPQRHLPLATEGTVMDQAWVTRFVPGWATRGSSARASVSP